jgi:hypothetical protein
MDYIQIVRDALKRLLAIEQQQEELAVEENKLHHFIAATVPMLPKQARTELSSWLKEEQKRRAAQQESLTQAIRKVLESNPKRWSTVAHVRDLLIQSGFDFSTYTSNPLASVSTTLKRMATKEHVIAEDIVDGVAAYSCTQPHMTLADLLEKGTWFDHQKALAARENKKPRR